MIPQLDNNYEFHSTKCLCDRCKMKGICKLEDFITANLDILVVPRGLRIECDHYTEKKNPENVNVKGEVLV